MTRKKIKQCPSCGTNSTNWEIEAILKSSQSVYEKKIALFNFVEGLKVGKLQTNDEQRINCLLRGNFYNELAKQNLREYKKLTVEVFSKVE